MTRGACIAAAAALLMATTTAQAKVFCTVLTLKDLKQVEYTFTPHDEETYAETKITRDGATLVHNSATQPLWSYDARSSSAYSALVYNRDPRWRLMVKDDGERLTKSLALANTVLMRDQQVVGIGACLVMADRP